MRRAWVGVVRWRGECEERWRIYGARCGSRLVLSEGVLVEALYLIYML